MRKTWIAAGLAGGAVLGGAAMVAVWAPKPEATAAGPMVEVSMPTLDGVAEAGRVAFEARCAACHGPRAGGRAGLGPPLVHRIYEPNHHGDMAFVLAARRGVVAHHWRFGNMAPVEGVGDAEIAAIIAYVRTLQQANGVF